VRYSDERTGVAEEITARDARIALTGISSPLDAKGSLVWRAEPIAFDTRLTTPKQLSEERPARLTLKLTGRPIDLDYDGAVTLGRAPETEGTIALKSPTLRSLAALLGIKLPDGPGLATASLDGRLKAAETALTLSDATFAIDQLVAQGTLTVETRGPRPLVRGTLQIAELDLNQFTLPAAGNAAPPLARPTAPRPPAARPPATVPAQSIEDLLREAPAKPGTKVQGYTRRVGWSDDVIDLSALRLVDADLKLALGRLIWRDVKVGQTQMRLALKNSQLTSSFDEIQLYEGRGSGLLKIDGAGAVPVIGANFSLDGTQAMALLKDAANFDWVAGRAKVTLALGGQGISERQIVASLQGRADVQFRDGAVVGYNVQKLLQGVMQGRLTGFERNVSDKTDFSDMAASFTIQNGIATNRDLRLTSPVLRITGAGTANLPDRTLDYTLRPKLVAGADGGAAGTALEIPVKLTGSWDRPVIAPDIDGVLKNPEQAIDTIKQLGRQFKGGDPAAVDKAKDLLNQFLKR
jgi:AsmA protein